MTKISFVFVAALSVAAFGCKKKGGGDCSQAINHSMDLSKATMTKMGVDDKMMAQMRDLGVKHCTEDKWPDDAIKCMTDAKAEAEAQECYGKLPADKREKMEKAAMELTPTPTGGPGSAAGSAAGGAATGADGSAAAGSGTDGSAAAGSAAAGSAAAGAAATGSGGSAAAPK